jgi:hypothetical protein
VFYHTLHQKACQVLFREVETFCKRHPRHKKRAGRRPDYSDALILKLVLLANLCGLKGETAILRHAERHYRFYLGRLPSQSRLWVRWRDMSSYIVAFRVHLMLKLGVDLEDEFVIDTFPVPICKFFRRGRHRGFVGADWGHCASKNWYYYGFKLGFCMTTAGIPVFFDLFFARPHDVNFLEALVACLRDCLVYADKGFIDQERAQRLLERQGVCILTPKRSNQKQQAPLQSYVVNAFRPLIETVGSQLVDHMHLQDLGAKADVGLCKRIIGVLTAFTMGIYINLVLGRPLLAVKELFA